MSATPSIVRDAFAPDHPHDLSLEAAIVLESVGCRYLTGGTPGLRDAVIVWLAITDLDSLKQARREAKVEELVEGWSKGRRPAELLALQQPIAKAVEAAFAPAAGIDGEESPLEKKDPPAVAGGSP